MKIVTYTCICGDRDIFRGGVDRAFLDTDGTAPVKFKSAMMNSRMPKTLAHQWLLDAEASLWLDGNVALEADVNRLEPFLGSADMALFAHPERSCVYEEMFACFMDSRYDRNAMRSQMHSYRAAGWPLGVGLWHCAVILRRHTPAVADFERRWWAEICRWGPMDQLSFPVAARMAGVAVATIPGTVQDNHNDFVTYRPHDVQRVSP